MTNILIIIDVMKQCNYLPIIPDQTCVPFLVFKLPHSPSGGVYQVVENPNFSDITLHILKIELYSTYIFGLRLLQRWYREKDKIIHIIRFYDMTLLY
jgi:hypothetical protein